MLALAQQQHLAPAPVLDTLVPTDHSGLLPASFAQQRLWFLEQLHGSGTSYLMCAGLRLQGTLDRTALIEALQALLARHGPLRSRFVPDGEQVRMQWLPAEQALQLNEHDLSTLDAAQADAALQHWLDHEASTPFQLEQGPLIRFRLLKLADDAHVLLSTTHHSASDAWSEAVLQRELAALYNAFHARRPNPLPALAIDYADYAAWQGQWLGAGEGKRQVDYWRAQLADAPTLIDLPMDRPRPPLVNSDGGELRFAFDAEFSDALDALSRRHGCTRFMTLLAGWGALLARLCRQSSVLIGSPFAGRTRAALEPLVGFFVNTLPVRVDVDLTTDTATLLAQVRRNVLAAQDHQELPFEQLVEHLQPVRDASYTPLVQVMFAWEESHAAPEQGAWAALQPQLLTLTERSAKFDLTLTLAATPQGLCGRLSYATALFDASTVARLVGYFEALLRGMLDDERRALATIELLSPAERRQLLHDRNQTHMTVPAGSVVQWFLAQAAATPDAIALVQGEQQLSYTQLQAQAEQLARHLRRLGVMPDARVAVCLRRSPQQVVGLLASLLAGAAYVPLDPEDPGERLAFLLADCRPSVLLADSATLSHLMPPTDLPICRMDDAAPAWAEASMLDEALALAQPHHLAYVIYTSGSTGTPKGVMVEHRALANLVHWHQQSFGLTAGQHTAATAAIGFDANAWELWPALCSGATLHLPPATTARDPQALLDWWRQQPLHSGFLVTPIAELALEQGALPPSLQQLLIGGDQLRRLPRLPAGLRLSNNYGPTETTVVATSGLLADGDHPADIGRPIANTRVYLLGAFKQLVPHGCVGELYIGGHGVARGYLHQPALSAERFIDDPFEPGERCYRSGDLARWRADGRLEFRGRADDQVKIRGFRIEPGEIAARLAACPGVAEAAVIATGSGATEKRLVAYITAQPDTDADTLAPAELRAALAAQLPDYMLPAAYVLLDALPLTANGKLDRRALPAPTDDALAARAFVPPQGPTECAIAAHWCALLGVQQVGRDDQFFALGGHSLLAIRLVERLRADGLHAQVRNLFTAPTLAGFAASLHGDNSAALVVPPNRITAELTQLTPQQLPLAELTQQDIDCVLEHVPGGLANLQDLYALSPLQDGLLFHHLLAPDGDPYLLRLRLRFADRAGLDAYLAALQRVIDRHDILRSAVLWEGLSEPVQAVYRHASLPVETLDCSSFDSRQSFEEQLAAHPQLRQLDLRRAPLLHASVVADPDGQRWHLLLLQHHLIGDHTTLETIQSEIQALLAGRGDELPPPQPFRNLVAQARLGLPQAAHEAFFRARLGDLDTPCAPFGLLDATGAVSSCEHALPPALSARLRQLASQHGVSLASLCHLAWGLVVARSSGCAEPVFGTVLFGRMDQADASTLGLFINTLPLRLRLQQHTGVAAALQHTHAELSALLRHEHASLALAQRCSAVPAPAPLFTALLNYRHNAGSNAVAAPPQDGALLSAEERTHYPLALSVGDDGRTLELSAQSVAPLAPERLCAFMESALQALAAALERSPDTALTQLAVLPPDERRQVLHSFNQTDAPCPDDTALAALFERQAQRSPAAIAVVDGARQIDYATLDARATALARQLRAAGVGPGELVAMWLPRSAELVLAQLAILKAGAVYVPLDPDAPWTRSASILDDCAARHLLHAAGRAPQALAATLQLHAVDLDTDAAAVTSVSPRPASAAALAYVMYTSGSSGRPKGVQITQRAVINLACNPACGNFTEQDRVAWVGNPAFDISTLEVWAPLLHGARLVVVDHAQTLQADALAQLIRREAISVLHLTAGLFQQHARALGNVIGQLRLLMVGGDAVDSSAIDHVLRQHPPGQLLHCYGPTEATTFATTCVLRQPLDGQRPPLGRPIGNARIYLLDGELQPVPIGVPGELCIGGIGVAHGYLNRPQLTAERFLADPFHPGGRIYRSGDLGRWLADGSLEFLGRGDQQVKIRGFRVEPGEVEAALRQCRGVAEAAVIAREDGPAGNGKVLVAYVTATTNAKDSELVPATLRAALAMRLPDYLVPAAFVRLHSLPLTRNGKLDRNALPAPDNNAFATHAYRVPEGATEVSLAGLWAELLGLPRIGRDDDFFALGGHSLLAMRLSARVQASLGRHMPVALLFAHPVLHALARALDAGTVQALAPIQRHARNQRLPLSFAQQRLWFLDQLQGPAATYLMPLGLRLRGPLDRSALIAALQALLARHEALRSCFVTSDGDAHVVLLEPEHALVLTEHALHDLSADASEAAVRQWLEQETQTPFQLDREAPIRFRLLQLGATEHVLLITQHHSCSDGWSVGVLLQELSTLYASCRHGQPDPLPQLPIQYPDYAAWQREWLQGPRRQQQLDYWQGQLADAPTLLDLPLDRQRPSQQDGIGAEVRFELDAELTRDLEALSRCNGCTLFMTLLAAWGALLSRLCRQDCVLVGIPVAGRTRVELEPLIGFFVNTLAIRFDTPGNLDATALLAQIRQAVLDAQAHQDLPFEQVVEALRPLRSTAYPPLVQTIFSWEDTPAMRQWDGLTIEPMPVANTTAKFELGLTVGPAGDGLVGQLNYATALFDMRSAQRFATHFQDVLRAMTVQPAAIVGQTQLLKSSERDRLLHAFNCSHTQFPQRGMATLFAEQAARAPQATALVCGDTQLSYGELDLQANRLAHHLRALGVGPDCLVAISAARSPALVIGLLAILKAGGAYLPLDTEAPPQRLRALLDDARPVAVLADAQSVHRLPLPDALPVCQLDQIEPAWATLSTTAPAVPELQPHHLAYVLYTSGSTGTPKGVMVEQRNVVRLVCAPDYAHCDASQCFLLAAPLAFDASTFELWGALLNGARLVLAPPGALNLDVICAQVQQHQVSTLWLTAGLFELLGPAQLAQLRSLRQLLAGGDVLSRAAVERVNQALPHCQLSNAYGPTEATTFSTCHRFAKAPVTAVPIGRPIASTRIYLLDDQRQLVPIGVPGELYIGGPGVARGYLNQPVLTEERFSEDPFVPGGRLYRSGDLARWREDGSLDFLGRCDQQLKVRGFRIEPGEIEMALRSCAGVADAVVIARQQGAADKQLVAYVVAATKPNEGSDNGIDDALDPATLREALAKHLPEHMLPSAFVRLHCLPLTASGKVDRRALPAPDRAAVAAAGYATPQGVNECLLAALWSELLGLPHVGRHDHFFELGGHSLLAMRVCARLQTALARHVPVALLFSHPVLCDLALALQDAEDDVFTPIPRLPRDQPLPLSFAQQRLWFLDQLEGPSATYIMPMGLRLHGALDRGALRAALHALVARHEALRSCFRQSRLPHQSSDIADTTLPSGLVPAPRSAEQAHVEKVHGEQVHVALLPPEHALVLHEHLLTDGTLTDHSDADTVLQQWIAHEANTPFRLDRDAPIRFRLLQLSADEHALLITQHHSASDGWSVGVLLHELAVLYVSSLGGLPNPLPPLPIQYPDYAAWQRQSLQAARRQQQVEYWQRQLADVPTLLDLPLDRPRPPQQDFSGAEVPVAFDADLGQALEMLARRHGCTVFMTVLAAWGALLSRLCRQDCVLVGIPVAGRTRAELEPLIGFFVNTLAIRFDTPASLSTAALLAHVKQHVLAAQAHQDLPFEQVVQAVQPVRSSAHTPLVQTLMAWEQDAIAGVWPTAVDEHANHPGTTDEPGESSEMTNDPWFALNPQLLQIPANAARFDLTLQLHSRGTSVGQLADGSQGVSIHGALSYATAVFDAATATRIVGYLHTLLRAMVADGDAPLDTVALLDPRERHQLLVEFQPAPVVYPAILLHEVIAQQVQRTPHAIAVAQDDQQLDYAALEAKANQLAHHLRQLGVGPDVCVAICAQRSTVLVVGLLAILKAGGAYVPLDPDYPAQRLADMLADSQPLALLVDAHARDHVSLFATDALGCVSLLNTNAAERLPPLDTNALDSMQRLAGLSICVLDHASPPWATLPTTAPHVPELQPHHLAYVIYTSGSTGTPKGAMITHRGVVNRLLWMQDTYALTPDDVVLQKTPISFDVSVWELFWPLLSGARLQLARPGGHKDPAYLGATIAEAAVTTLHFVPSMLDAFLATDAPQQCSGLTRVICSGEALPGQLVQRFRTQLPGVQLHNLYGPTEAAIDVSFWDCTASNDIPDNTPIGTPVANTQLYVLDTHLQPVPIGVAGELHIGGVQVARGYLDRPELTPQRFIPDPFRPAPDAQLYKTGDLARWRSDGVLEYLGRNDDQVKIRGLRIEPGEIAARLATHPQVRDAVLLARTDQPGQLRLVAYYLATTALPIEILRSHLAGQLPDYMVPAAYVHLDALPLTPNGKLDRRALPAPTEEALATRDFVPPQGPTENIIAAHWCELLGVQHVGRDDQFFALGGHSLLAIHLIERLRADGLHAEVRNLFAAPTLAGFAASLHSNTETNAALIVLPNRITQELNQLTPHHLPLADLTQQDIDRVLEQVPGGLKNVQDIYALSPFQHGLLFHHLLASTGDPYILSAQWAFADRAAAQRFLAALQAVIDRHDILRSAVVWEGLSEPVQVVLRQAQLQVEVLDPDTLEPNDQTSAQLDDHTTPLRHRLDLRHAPLMHATLVHDKHAQRWLLALRWHHMVGDHATLDLLMDEIQQYLDEHAAQLPPPSPFRTLVAHTRQPEVAVQQQHFFRRLLGDVDTATAPFGLVGLHPEGAPVQEQPLPLDPALSERLRIQAKAAGASLASLCHLAWGLVVARAAGADDAVFGTVLLGRMGQADAQLMGPCINVLPVRVRSNSDGVRTALQQLHLQLAELLLHEHASLSMVQRCSGVPAPAPLFNSLINYRHQSPARAQHSFGGAQLLHASERSPLPLVISVEDFGTALGLTAQALPEIDALRVCRFMQSALLQLVQALEQAPDTPLHDIDLLPAEEAARLRNRGSTARPIDEHALHRWFEIQAQRTPEALAVECGAQRLSYAELDLQANRLAHYLQTAGVAPERLVAVIATPGPQAMTAILATLKAGGAYLALDPCLPTARLMQLLADSAPLLVLADSAGVQQLGAAHDLKVCALDDPAPAWKNLATTAPALPDLSPHHLAYVVYTSGSSGVPKAVLVEHHSTANLAAAQLAAFDTKPGDRVAQLAPHGVDTHVFEWLLALASGASLHVPPATQARSGESLHQWLAQSQITHAVLPPAVLQSLPRAPLPHLHTLIAAGDILPAALARHWAAGRRLFNAYGPSEATVWSTLHQCYADEHTPPAIGLPIANTRIYLLDAAGRLVPDGTPGEICIAGRTVARGYLGHTALSAAAFVADPFDAGERMYRSGDLARWRSDGTLEFLGRRDRQLKLSGYRVEPGEIEAALREACSELAEVLVTLHNTDQAEPVLAAYLVARPGADRQSLSPAALRAMLAARLPAHMVPAAYVQLDALPLSANGKHDLRALPAPRASDRAIAAFSPPRGVIETQIATLWAELLALPQVGRDDAFFAIGGDSMRAIAFLQQASRLGLSLDLRQLYQAHTPAGLAALLQTDTDANATHVGSPVDLPPAPSQDVRSSP